VQLNKLEIGSDAQVIVANSSGEGVWKTVSGDATVDNLGAVTIAAGAVEHSMLATGLLPSGAIIQYGGTSAPTGWLFCDGSAKDSVADATLAALFTAIGTTYGGTGSDAFNLPDLRGRIPMGTNDAGLPNGLLTSDTARPTERNEGATGGTETHTLEAAEMPAHTHTQTSGYFQPSYRNMLEAGADGIQVFTTSDPTGSTGGGGPHANIQPFVVVNYIIKT
jgi:microcystin-dependent protein